MMATTNNSELVHHSSVGGVRLPIAHVTNHSSSYQNEPSSSLTTQKNWIIVSSKADKVKNILHYGNAFPPSKTTRPTWVYLSNFGILRDPRESRKHLERTINPFAPNDIPSSLEYLWALPWSKELGCFKLTRKETYLIELCEMKIKDHKFQLIKGNSIRGCTLSTIILLTPPAVSLYCVIVFVTFSRCLDSPLVILIAFPSSPNCLILFELDESRFKGSLPFHFFTMWLSNE